MTPICLKCHTMHLSAERTLLGLDHCNVCDEAIRLSLSEPTNQTKYLGKKAVRVSFVLHIPTNFCAEYLLALKQVDWYKFLPRAARGFIIDQISITSTTEKKIGIPSGRASGEGRASQKVTRLVA